GLPSPGAGIGVPLDPAKGEVTGSNAARHQKTLIVVRNTSIHSGGRRGARKEAAVAGKTGSYKSRSWRQQKTRRPAPAGFSGSGAGNETRTRDLNLGKVALYQLSYSRVEMRIL